SFSTANFRHEVIGAWLNFYVLAQTVPEARRLLSIYHRRLHSNLCHDLRPLLGARAEAVARHVGALIDGVYIREALRSTSPDAAAAADEVLAYIKLELRDCT
ncbi:MAG: TetR family transcriptional regulator C-terminal domain-containing protein, partial [Rhodobacteraceae bacterium]|nr:TetR family transcriptional regulator C-terminal domain-containing protein [Paracoccaceae bacterium]